MKNIKIFIGDHMYCVMWSGKIIYNEKPRDVY